MSRVNTNSRMAYNRDYQANRYEALKSSGMCRWCGKHPAKVGRNGKPGCRCESCATKAAERSKANMRRKRVGWRSLGICVVCGCREAIQRQRWCAVCAERRDETR